MCTSKTQKNCDFSDIDEIFNDYITNQNRKFDLYLVKNDLKLVFDANSKNYAGSAHNEFQPFFKSEFQSNATFLYRETFSEGWFEYFSARGYVVSHFNGMNITTISSKRYTK